MYFDKTRNDVFYYGLPKTLLILGTVLVRTHIFPDGNNRELVSVWDKTTCVNFTFSEMYLTWIRLG